MRVLVTSTPGAGHVLPVVPLVRAVAAAGHDVRWALPPDGHRLVAAAGLTPVAAGMTLAERGRRFADGWPDVRTLPPRARRAVLYPALFATLSAPRMLHDLGPVVASFPPDLVVHEPNDLAAPPVARGLGVPHVTVAFGRLLPDELLALARPELTGVWSAIGGEVPADLGLYDDYYLHPLPPSMEPAPPGRRIGLLRPTGYDGTDDGAETDGAEAARRPPVGSAGGGGPAGSDGSGAVAAPTVYVTFGTEFGRAAPWRAVLDGLGDLGAAGLVTVGSQLDPADLGPVPGGVRIERWIPQRRALADADVLVSHGGAGAMLGALVAGRPHLALPIAADHFDNADLIEAAGVGRRLEGDEVDASSIAGALRSLLGDAVVRDRLGEVEAEVAAMPAAAEVVADLEALADAS